MVGTCCRGKCDALKRKGLAKGHSNKVTYENGWPRCSICVIHIHESACNRKGEACYCPCCNYRMRLNRYTNTPAMLAGFARY